VSFTPIQKIPSDKAIGFIVSPNEKEIWHHFKPYFTKIIFFLIFVLMRNAQQVADKDRNQSGCQSFQSAHDQALFGDIAEEHSQPE
jgi:hypothetical protein